MRLGGPGKSTILSEILHGLIIAVGKPLRASQFMLSIALYHFYKLGFALPLGHVNRDFSALLSGLKTPLTCRFEAADAVPKSQPEFRRDQPGDNALLKTR